MKLLPICLVSGTFALLLGAQPAVTGGIAVAQRTDPQPGSPSGVIYQIPLDSGRREAAPVLPVGSRRRESAAPAPSGGSGASGGGSGPSGSSGSSPGGSPSAGRGGGLTRSISKAGSIGHKADLGKGDLGLGGGTPNDPSSIHSENGFGSASQVPGLTAAALQTGAGVATAHSAGSILSMWLLVTLVTIAAIVVGLLATRRSPRTPNERPPSRPVGA